MLDLTADEVRCGFVRSVCLAACMRLKHSLAQRPDLTADEVHRLTQTLGGGRLGWECPPCLQSPPNPCHHCSLSQAEKHLSDLVVGGSLPQPIIPAMHQLQCTFLSFAPIG